MYVQLCIYYIGLENYSNAILVVLQFIFVDIHMGCFTTVFSPAPSSGIDENRRAKVEVF